MSLKYPCILFLILPFTISCNPIKKIAPVIKPTVIIPPLTDSIAVIKPAVITLPDSSKTDSFLVNILKQHPQYFDSVLQHRKDWNIQIIYTQIDRGENNIPALRNYYFNVDRNKYFYPASTLKLPATALALQRLNELKDKGVTRNTTMISEAAYSGQTAVYNDPTTPDGKPNITNYIKKIFLVSDNDAFNRLYEFLGQEYINKNLHDKGYQDAQLLHRLDIFLNEDENRHTNPVKFLDSANNIIYQQPLVFNQTKYLQRHDSLGTSFYKGDSLIHSPMNFSKKNRICLEDLHSILRSLIFPNTVSVKQRFNLTPEDYTFIYQYMSQFPGETTYPPYDTTNYYDAYGKFLLYGSGKGTLPKNIRVFNKVGDAYGQLTDIAYIIDLDKNIEFFLSATINCNINGVVNNDNYSYEAIGFPFMKNLGKVIYDYEVNRKRTHSPDLSEFKIVYDKQVY